MSEELTDLIIQLDNIIYNKNTSDEDRLFFANQKADLLFGLGQYIDLEKISKRVQNRASWDH